jgi:hypothetical protein
MVDLVTGLVAGLAGAGLGVGAAYFFFYRRPEAEKVIVAARSSNGEVSVETVPAPELEKSKREMRTLIVERDLLSSALMKLYEAENEGRITRDEREAISKRYSEQIKELQGKLKDVELIVEVGELEGLRSELVTLFETKIQNIEGRLEAARLRLGPAAPQPLKKEAPPKLEKTTELERVVEKKARSEVSEAERARKEIRDEVMEALARLEQIDIERNKQEP